MNLAHQLSEIDYSIFQSETKKIFQETICKGKVLTWEDYLNISLRHFSLREDELPIAWKESLYQWWDNVTNASFIARIFSTIDDFEEVQFISSTLATVQFKQGKTSIPIKSLSLETYQLALEIICLKHHINWNSQVPFASFLFPFQNKMLRLSLVHFSISPHQQSFCALRAISSKSYRLSDWQFSSTNAPSQIQQMIHAKKNILVAGATGSGKTTFLKTLLGEIPENERIIILEDTHELQTTHPLVSHLLSAPESGKTLKDFCTYALRLTPERLLLGEIRSDEVVPFLLAMNTGHNGMLATVHANNARDALYRLALLFTLYSGHQNLNYQQVMKLICQGIDYVIYIEQKKITQIIHVIGEEEGAPYFEES